ncbi:hypothetical protein BS47DRAFT_1316137 [Hydnum rufescens UP504]|uniref:Protein YIF1 n=1 Tax=Hydnum rufescens UP504 TaxID=1448309 RepID=A0A9P6B0S9_9AGAM|nr:hypothetical protein BS47DRAFT_1316137 [Hydnum rufescens UP504]
MRFQGSPQPVPYAAHTSNRVPNVAGYGPQYQTFAGTVPMHPLGPSVPLVPNLTAWGVNDATAQMGMQFGRSAVAAGQDYVEKNINTYLPVSLLKHQFNVSNSYVLQKLRLVIFPWRHRPWSRQVRKSDAGQNEGWKPPREDINSPDLYIPSMAIVTYVLLAALHAGLQKRFNPEMLGVTSSKAFGVILSDFLIIKLGCYALAISGQGQVVDIFAYSGYKFEGIVVTLLARLLGVRGFLYWAIFLYTFVANAFFMLRSLRYVVLPDPTTSPSNVSVGNSHIVTHSQRGQRRNFLLFVAASQILWMWVLAV